MYFVDSGRPLTDAPPLLKTRRHMRRDAASKLWRKLQEQVGARSKPSGARAWMPEIKNHESGSNPLPKLN